MYHLPAKNKGILTKNIRKYKERFFKGKGGGARLAEEAGVPPQTVSNWLSGKRHPTLRQLYRLSIAFGVNPMELCGIRDNIKYSRKTAHVTLILAIMNQYKDALECNVNPHAIKKILSEINDIMEKELNDLEK